MNTRRVLAFRAVSPLLLVGLVPPLAAGMLALINYFDGLYGQDAFAYYNYAVFYLREQLFPPPPFFWPPGYPLLILLMTLIVGITPLAGQLVSLICGGLTAIFTALLTREVCRNEEKNAYVAPLVAGLTIAFTGQLWQSSAVIMADTPSLVAATLGMWMLARWTRLVTDNASHPQVAYWLMLASGALAYAVITRWIYSVVALVAGLWAMVILYRTYRHAFGISLQTALLALIPALLILGPVLLPALTRPPGTDTIFGGNFQYQFVSWDLINAFRRDFVNPDGFNTYALPNAVYYGTLPARTFYFAPVLAAFIPLGLVEIVRRRTLYRFVLVLGWVIAVYLLLVGGPQQNVRFGLSYMPPLAVLVGIGAAAGWRWLDRWSMRSPAFALIISIGLTWAGVSGAQWTQDFIQQQQESLAIVRWAETHIPPDAQVIAFGLTHTMQHYTSLETHEIYNLTPVDLATIVERDQPTYLLLDLGNVETQWREQSPATHYRWLQDIAGLTRIGQSGAFTLFQVGVP
jgi:hypothetical protein